MNLNLIYIYVNHVYKESDNYAFHQLKISLA